MTKNLRSLGDQISVPIPRDDHGYIGRECPAPSCLRYFKVVPGTGIQEPAPCHCPYCGHAADASQFFTQEQIEFAKSVLIQKVTGAIQKDMKALEFNHRPRRSFGIGMSLTVKHGPLPSLRHYQEQELETAVLCDRCTLQFAIYGVFGWCPDCGIRNSMQILIKNLELTNKKLTLAETVEAELAEHLIGSALEGVVSAFDGFGREVRKQKGHEIRFQNLSGARQQVQKAFGFDFADGLTADEYMQTFRSFQKRHLLAHKMGVVDEDYCRKANDPQAVIGRMIPVDRTEIQALIQRVEKLGPRLFTGLFPS